MASIPPPSLCEGRRAGYMARDVTDCRAYFSCHPSGLILREFCIHPSLFNEAAQSCDFVTGNVNCFQCPTHQLHVDLEVAGSCNQFIRCIAGRPQHLECARGLSFDPFLETCNHNHLVTCAANQPTQCPVVDNPNSRVFIPDVNNCSMFIICVAGHPVRRRCASSLHFNLATTLCDLPENANCRGVTTIRMHYAGRLSFLF